MLCFVPVARAIEAEAAKVTVFKAGEDGYHTYRIPAIVRAKNGDLLAFAEARKNSRADHGDVDIVMKRSADGGKTWGAMRLVQDEWADPTAKVWIGNPVPIVDLLDKQHPGRIWLAFTRSNERMFVTSSDDNGKTWAERREITQEAGNKDWIWYAAGPVHGIQLQRGSHAGRIIIPSDHRIGDREKASWGSHLVYSDDHGATWKLGAADTHKFDEGVHPNECVAVELVDGRVYVNARDQNGSDPATRTVAYSSDGGETFDARFVPEPQISTPVVQNSLIRFSAKDQGDARNLLVYSGPGDPKARRDLTILTSEDEGKTWQRQSLIQGHAAYSDLVKLDGKRVGVLFETGAKAYGEIVFAEVGVNEFAPLK